MSNVLKFEKKPTPGMNIIGIDADGHMTVNGIVQTAAGTVPLDVCLFVQTSANTND